MATNKTKRTSKTYRKNRLIVIENQFQQHGRNFCEECNKFVQKFPTNLHFSLTIDHIKPLIKGGGNEISNLRVCCLECNMKKG